MSDAEKFEGEIGVLIKRLEKVPEDVGVHRALREVGVKRAVAGGKPAGGFLGAKLPYEGKGTKEGMLNAEYVMAMDPVNLPAMMDLHRCAKKAGYGEVVEWIGQVVKETMAGFR